MFSRIGDWSTVYLKHTETHYILRADNIPMVKLLPRSPPSALCLARATRQARVQLDARRRRSCRRRVKTDPVSIHLRTHPSKTGSIFDRR